MTIGALPSRFQDPFTMPPCFDLLPSSVLLFGVRQILLPVLTAWNLKQVLFKTLFCH
jgi:hypothetical protein